MNDVNSSFQRACVITIAVAVVILHLLGAGPLSTMLWGTHAYAFLPRWVLPLAAIALTAAVTWSLRARQDVAPAPERPSSLNVWWRRPTVAWSIASVGAFVMFWGFRSRALFLGDGLVLTRNLPVVDALHPREPLTALIHQGFHVFTSGFFDSDKPAYLMAADAVALSSALAGVAFVAVAWGLAGELLRVTSDAGSGQRQHTARWLLAGVIASQGFVQLFFGYVENYTFLALGIAVYLLTAMRWLRGASPLWLPGVVLVITTGFHLSAAALGGSWLVLVVLGLWKPERRGATLVSLGLATVAFVLLVTGLARLEPGYRIDQEILTVGRSGLASMDYLLSAQHQRDFVSEQILIGPYGLFWFLPLVIWTIAGRSAAHPTVGFLGTAGLMLGASHWFAPDLSLGYARDWDIFAPAGIVYTFAAGALMARSMRSTRIIPLASIVFAVSLFHTLPWIAINASADRALERFKQLPLGLGRTESTVGYWYGLRGDTEQSRRWLVRAIEANPGNVRAHVHLANLFLDAGKPELAVAGFRTALQLQPHRSDLREALVRGLLSAGRLDDAVVETRILTETSRDQARAWALHAVALLGVVEPAAARDAMDRAIALRPDREDYRSARRKIDEADGFGKILDDEWATIVRW